MGGLLDKEAHVRAAFREYGCGGMFFAHKILETIKDGVCVC